MWSEKSSRQWNQTRNESRVERRLENMLDCDEYLDNDDSDKTDLAGL